MNTCRYVRRWTAAMVCAAVFSGCAQHQTGEPAASATVPTAANSVRQVPSSPAVPAASGQHSPQQTNLPNDSGMQAPGSDPTAAQPQPGASPTGKKVETSSDTKPPAPEGKTPPPAIEAYDAKKPSLMGLRLTDTKKSVTDKFGEPADGYVMEDEKDPITVFEYEGFTVGFNAENFVQFVEITSKDVNPGLNGLRLGQKVKDALKALGDPDLNTTYALSYKAGGTILKLDIDPKTETIQSIKLFGDGK